MKPTFIKPGTKMEIHIKQNVGTLRLFTTFEEDLPEGMIVFAAPFYKSVYYPFRRDDEFRVVFFDAMNRYEFSAAAVERIKRGELTYIVAVRKSEIEKLQRRSDFRVDISIDLPCWRVTGEDVYGRPKFSGKPMTLHTIDLSGGGVGFFHNDYFEFSEKLLVQLPILKKGEPLKAKGSILWSRILSAGFKYRYQSGIELSYDHYLDKELVVRFVFEQQRKLIAGQA